MGFVKAVKPCSCFCADTTGYFSFAAKLVCIVVDRHFRDEYRCNLNDCHKQYHHNQHCNRDVDISLATSRTEPFKKFFSFLPPYPNKIPMLLISSQPSTTT